MGGLLSSRYTHAGAHPGYTKRPHHTARAQHHARHNRETTQTHSPSFPCSHVVTNRQPHPTPTSACMDCSPDGRTGVHRDVSRPLYQRCLCNLPPRQDAHNVGGRLHLALRFVVHAALFLEVPGRGIPSDAFCSCGRVNGCNVHVVSIAKLTVQGSRYFQGRMLSAPAPRPTTGLAPQASASSKRRHLTQLIHPQAPHPPPSPRCQP